MNTHVNTLLALALASTTVLGCASDDLDLSDDCESCDVVLPTPTPTFVVPLGLECDLLTDQTDHWLACVGVGNRFEGTVSARPAPAVTAGSQWVGEEALSEGFTLELGDGYQPGSRFQVHVEDASYYYEPADDWIPFDTVIEVRPDELPSFTVSLPFHEVRVPMLSERRVTATYAIAGDPSLAVSFGASSDGFEEVEFLTYESQATVELRIGDVTSTILLNQAWVVDWYGDVPSIR
ncbi:MAG: hypothetical protein KJO07_23965, partial [Deltaproteobacteria bacterium]|nr:hypothetical protein [Deltaproteobacteria bacterium]